VATRRVLAPRIDFSALRRELELPARFPEAARDDAVEAAARGPRPQPRADRTDLPLVTIDPPASRDLDQAMYLVRRDNGYRVHYAIADVAAFVDPDGPLDRETHQRGQTVYFPDAKVPLHPVELSEGAASLLPDQGAPAVLWTLDLDATGGLTATRVERALVRSRAKLSYDQVQSDVDAGRTPEPIALLPEIGRLLVARGLDRGAIDLPLPDQEIEPDGPPHRWRLRLRTPVAVEEYNAQISLLTGMAAATLMMDGRIGLLRTMPPAPPDATQRLRAAAQALGIEWPEDESAGALLARLRPLGTRETAFVEQAAELLRGAAYTSFDGQIPAQPRHSAVAAPYAHVTAPLRRLADRYATGVCLALHDGRDVPDHVRAALPALPATMGRTDRVANTAERAAVDLVEAILLQDRVGEEFGAAVVDADGERGGTIALDDPPVRARCRGPLTLGSRVRVRLVEADPVARKVRFEAAATAVHNG
jgi:exoribonuclease R